MVYRKKNYALVLSGICTLVFAANAFAGGWEGDKGESGSGVVTGGGGISNFPCNTDTIDCKGVSWLKYNYVPTGDSQPSPSINFAPRGGSGDYGVAPDTLSETGMISGECAKAGVGFYHLGINSQTPYNSYTNKYGITSYNGIPGSYMNNNKTVTGYRNGQGLTVNVPMYNGNDMVYSPVFAYLGGNNTYIHRGSFTKNALDSSFGEAHYYAMSYNNKKDATAPVIEKAGYTYNHALYYKQPDGKYVKLYQSANKASTEQTVINAYKKFLDYKYPKGGDEALRESKKGYCTYSDGSWSCNSIPSNVYGFCAFGEGEQPKKIQNRSVLQYDNYESVSAYAGETNFDNADSFKDVVTSGKTKYTNDKVINVSDGTVTVSAKFDFKTADGKNYKSKSFNYTIDVTGDSPAPESKTTSFNGTNAISGEGISDAVVINITPGSEKTVCATVTSDETIQPTGSTAGNTGSTTSKACMKFLWDPVVSKVHSTSTINAKVNNNTISATSGPDNTGSGAGKLELGEAKPDEASYRNGVAYGKNALNLVWTHSLYINEQQYFKKLKDGEGYVNYFDNSPVIVHAKPDSPEAKQDISAGGRTQEVTAGVNTVIKGWDSIIFTRPENPPVRYKNANAISEDLTLVPGQPINVSDGIYHDSEVYGNGDSYNGANDDAYSSAYATGVANYAECKLTSDNNTTVIKYIGAKDAANDYAGHYVDSSKGRVIVGDGNGSASKTIWLKGTDNNANLSFNYEACFGEQIAEDYANGAEAEADSFKLNENEYVSSDEYSKANGTTQDPYNLMNVAGDNRAINAYAISGRRTVKYNANKHILAGELGTGGFEGRLNNGYSIKASSNSISPSKLLGHSNVSSISKTDGINGAINATYSITTNVPYNYILDPQPGNMDSLDVVTVGSDIKYQGKIQRTGRKNEEVDGTTPYVTNSKTSVIKTNIFVLHADDDIDGINPSGIYNGQVSTDSGKYYKVFTIQGKDENASIKDLIGHEVVTEDKKYEKVNINTSSSTYAGPDGVKAGDEIGAKYCFAIGVYPADSHNTGTGDIALGADQTAALSGDKPGSNALWRVSVSCRTVAKYPSVSVEGNGLRTGGAVHASKTTIDGNIFGSWVEYGLVSDAGSNISTGATLAYASLQGGINQSGATGSKDLTCLGVQSVGNKDECDSTGSSSEAEMVKNEMRKTKSNLSRFKTDKGSEIAPGIKISTENGIYRIYSNNNSDIVSRINEVANSTGTGIDAIAVNFTGTFRIDNDITNSTKRQILIFADNIEITNNVEKIDAWLIAEGNIDTCADSEVGYDDLGEKCGNSLIVNGPVIANSIELDRTYGAEAEGTDANGMIRRGEVFNYNPSSVLWVYKESLKDSKTEIQYVKERAVRY